MIYCIYNPETNELLGVTQEMPEGKSFATLGREMPDFAKEAWNPATLSFFTKPDVGLSKLEYLRRFTPEERVKIRGAAANDPVLADYLALLELAQDIRLTDPGTVSAVSRLEQSGLIAAGRAAEILA